jgi:hypothetical protein
MIALSTAKAIAILKFNQQDDGDRTSSKKLIAITNNQVIISHIWVAFLNPAYKIGDRTNYITLILLDNLKRESYDDFYQLNDFCLR